nr:PREDICTED: stromal membrane-associated protein 2 isoform X1 [Lepisosteus oculatus]
MDRSIDIQAFRREKSSVGAKEKKAEPVIFEKVKLKRDESQQLKTSPTKPAQPEVDLLGLDAPSTNTPVPNGKPSPELASSLDFFGSMTTPSLDSSKTTPVSSSMPTGSNTSSVSENLSLFTDQGQRPEDSGKKMSKDSILSLYGPQTPQMTHMAAQDDPADGGHELLRRERDDGIRPAHGRRSGAGRRSRAGRPRVEMIAAGSRDQEEEEEEEEERCGGWGWPQQPGEGGAERGTLQRQTVSDVGKEERVERGAKASPLNPCLFPSRPADLWIPPRKDRLCVRSSLPAVCSPGVRLRASGDRGGECHGGACQTIPDLIVPVATGNASVSVSGV